MAVASDTRLEDYLSDKFQTIADFKQIDSLLETVSLQKQQLDEQLKAARTKLEESKKLADENASRILDDAKLFERQQNDVNKRIMLVTSSSSVDEATKRLAGPMEKLRKVELAAQYIELLKEINGLVSDARSHLPGYPVEALKPYDQLKQLAITLRQKQVNAEGAGVHLINHVEQTTTRLWTEMNKIMVDEFQAELTKSKWPSVKADPSREWRNCFEKLLELQYPELGSAREPLVLLPIGLLAKPFIQNFKYQFMSNKPTSHSKHLGDYYLEWVIVQITGLEDYLRNDVAPSLAGYFRNTHFASNTLYVDPVSAFITALLPILKEKTLNVVEAISQDAALLSRFVAQLLKFDETIRSQFKYDAGSVDDGWSGLVWDVLDTNFDRFLEVEKSFAFDRYEEIIKSPNSGLIDHDSARPGKTKWTHGAYQITDLLSTVTETYQNLPHAPFKERFLLEVQLEIVNRYQGRLIESLVVYRTITSGIGRAVHGITSEQRAKLEGVGGLDSLCRVYGSANHIVEKMKDWGRLDFFLSLFLDLSKRAQNSPRHSDFVGSMSFNEVKDATSDSLGTDSDETGSIFDKLIASYKKELLEPVTELLIDAFKYNFPTIFRPYISRAQWTTVGDVDDSVTISSELDHPIKILQEQLNYLASVLAFLPFRRIWRVAYDSLEDLLWREVLMRQNFTALGAARFSHDIKALQSVVDRACRVYRPTGGADLEMDRLQEGAMVLTLPLTDETGGPSLSNEESVQLLNLRFITKQDTSRIIRSRIETSTDFGADE